MNGLAILFLLVSCGALVALPRRWAPLPLVAGTCYMTLGQGIEIGPFHFYLIRILLLVAVVRVLARRERPAGGFVPLDRVLLLWGAVALASSAFHKEPGAALVFRLGLVYNALCVYFLIRAFCQSLDDLTHLAKITGFVLVPVALEMVSEHVTGRDMFAFLGAVPDLVTVRNDRLRAAGPFSISILAGTVGAVCLPLMIGLWRRQPSVAKLGLAACLVMVITSTSSGPLLGLGAGVLALLLWRWRRYTRQMRIAAVVAYILLDLVMKAPAYYLMARVDLVGGSSSYHRAALIEAAIKYWREWYFAGTDYTRHWMPYGVSWSEDHCDITNQYLLYGVQGGLPLMLLFITALWVAFHRVGRSVRASAEAPFADQFMMWSLGAALFAHAVSCVSIAYFDQSFLFLYMNLGMIGSLGTPALQPGSAAANAALDEASSFRDVGAAPVLPALPSGGPLID